MPPAVAAVIATVGSVVIGAIKVSLIVKALLTIALTAATMLLTKKPKSNRLNQGQELRTKFDPTMPRQVMVGLVASGGSCHFAWTGGGTAKKPNANLYRVVQVSDRPIHSVVRIMEGAQELTFAGDITTGWRACNQHRTKNGAASMWMRFYLGSDMPTADSTLISETGGVWTTDHKGTGLAYYIVKYVYDEDAFSGGEPELTVVMEGAHLYDDRADSTVDGGSGDQRLNNYSTWEYSETTSVIIAQLLRGFYTNGKLIVGVQAEERDLNTDMLFSAHNTCEAVVEDSTGDEPRYVSGMALAANEPISDLLMDLQASMDGRIFDRGGAITILPGADRTPVLNLTDEDIIWIGEKSWQPKASLEQMLNHVTSNFIDAGTNFQERNLPVLSNPDWEEDDGGERFSEFFSFRAVNKWSQGQRITKRIHEASRYSGTAAILCPIWMLEVEQGDWITLTSARWDFEEKYFEVQEETITADARIALVLREVNPDSDIWDHVVDEKPRDDSEWIPPVYDIPEPNIYAIERMGVDATSGVETFGIEMGLDDDPALYGTVVKYLEFQYSDLAETDIVDVPIIAITLGKTIVTGLIPNTDYKVRGRFRDNARGGPWSDWVPVTTDIATALESGYGPYLTNGNAQVGVDSDGDIPLGGLGDAGGQFIVLLGGTLIASPDIAFSVLSETGIDVEIDPDTGVYTVEDLTADSGVAWFRAVVDGGPTIDLQFTAHKVYGIDPIYVPSLTNENHTVRADGDGNGASFTSANGHVVVTDGIQNIIASADVVIGSPTLSNVTGTVNTATDTPVNGFPKGYYAVSAMSADQGYMDIPVEVHGVDYTLRVTMTRTRNGASMRMWGTRTRIEYDANGSANPSTQDTTFNVIVLGAANSGITWEVASATGAFGAPGSNLTVAGDTLSATMTRAQFEAIAGSTAGVRVKASKTVNGVTIEDIMSLSKGQQGTNAKVLKIWGDRTQIKYDGAGSATPSTQTTTFVAEKTNTSATVTWTVFDLAGNARTPTSTYLSSATGDTVNMTRTQFESARNGTAGVQVKATLTDVVTLTDSLTLMRVDGGAAGADGDDATGFWQDTPVPVSVRVDQLWYRPTTKEWYRAIIAGADQIIAGEWVRINGTLGSLDTVTGPYISSGAINTASETKIGATVAQSNQTVDYLSSITNFTILGIKTRLSFDFIYEFDIVNPTNNAEYYFDITGLMQRVSNSAITTSETNRVSWRWQPPSVTGTRYSGRMVGHLEFVFAGLAGVPYNPGYRLAVPNGWNVTFYPYRYLRIDDVTSSQ